MEGKTITSCNDEQDTLEVDISSAETVKLTMQHPEVLDFEIEFDLVRVNALQEILQVWKEENGFD